MMSPDSLVGKPGPEEGPSSMEAGKMAPPRPPDEQLRCPRCDSPNTKFCYYNNYSLTQPRYFCKTCRRYWTKGGALRNVPIGGGCRKSKKSKSAASKEPSPTSSDSSTGLNFLHGFNPAVEFQLGSLPFSRLTTHSTTPFNQFFAFSDLSSSSSASPSTPNTFETAQNSTNPLIGFHHSLSSIQRPGEGVTFGGGVQEVGSNNLLQQSNIASSIESLSSINQDLHLKLQQHRMALLYGSENQKMSHLLENQQQPNSFQVEQSPKVEAFGVGDSRKGCDDVNIRESLFGNSYNRNSNNNSNSNYNTSSWNEIQTWGDLHQYNPLP